MFAELFAFGIPTVSRDASHDYLQRTVQSLLDNLYPGDSELVTILIFNANLDPQLNMRTTQQIFAQFPEQVESGLIQVVRANAEFYPKPSTLQKKFNDDEHRTAWRSKQVLDYAFMFAYAHNISSFYIHLEDDVITIPGYVDFVAEAVHNATKRSYEEPPPSEVRMEEFMLNTTAAHAPGTCFCCRHW